MEGSDRSQPDGIGSALSNMDEDELFDATGEVTVSRDMRGHIQLARRQAAFLLLMTGPRMGERVLLHNEPLLIGRGSSCGLALDADSVSRQHARIERTRNGYRIVDLKSTNGTLVNDQRIVCQQLRDGDRLHIGKAQLKYVAGGNIESLYHEELQRLAHLDGLTGAFNKRTFQEKVRQALISGRGAGKPVSIVVFDLDHFKSINDTHGHAVGDAVLRQVAQTAQNVIGTSDETRSFGRVGGEEFAAVFVGKHTAEASELAERIRLAVGAQPFRVEKLAVGVTVSLGVAEVLPESTEGAGAVDGVMADLLGRADARLYEAKRNGRNQVRI